MKARLLGTIAGRKVYRVPVRVTLANSRGTLADWCDPPRAVIHVTAHSAADAADYVRDQYATRAETQIEAFGPAGGVTRRFVGWHSAVGAALWSPGPTTARLPLPARPA
jgi:hypothetical protein